MKKFLALLLALVMVFALAACGEAETEETTPAAKRPPPPVRRPPPPKKAATSLSVSPRSATSPTGVPLPPRAPRTFSAKRTATL